MKTPDRKLCPCCEASTDDARAECVQAEYGDVREGEYLLYWVCRNCGCRWEHGQSDKPEQKGTQ